MLRRLAFAIAVLASVALAHDTPSSPAPHSYSFQENGNVLPASVPQAPQVPQALGFEYLADSPPAHADSSVSPTNLRGATEQAPATNTEDDAAEAPHEEGEIAGESDRKPLSRLRWRMSF
jgi:hypothetical protein